MIRQSKNQKVKTFFGRFIFAVLVCAFAQGASAQTIEKLSSVQTTADIKYMGISDGMLLFNVQYHNPNAEKYSFEITESSNNNLFRELGNDKLFAKKFKIPTDMGELKFVIRNLKDNSVQTFLVNRNQRVYEDVVVKKMN